jgi:hypothetical protein
MEIGLHTQKYHLNFNKSVFVMNLTLQDIVAILTSILGPIGTLIGFMWYHFNNKFEKIDHKFENLDEKINSLRNEIKGDINSVKEEINSVEKKLGEKIDAVRDRVSRIEGQLAPASIVSLRPVSPKKTAGG